ncbi:hypothetical protein C496_14802 [Natronorubrum tibetense GA33]|uniref:Uncharacterized protein n=1 Tax=Natronorubrum tibetense GA33 TaxID=1114856 RepID=L9VQ12_9EURY|nr:hypothetical protein C496_14802 [Natronorubrum tibetense GA33]
MTDGTAETAPLDGIAQPGYRRPGIESRWTWGNGSATRAPFVRSQGRQFALTADSCHQSTGRVPTNVGHDERRGVGQNAR